MSDPVYIGYYTLDNALSMPNNARFLMYDPAGPGSYNITGALLKSQILASPVITGQMTVPAGSVSAPSMSTAGDTNTGIYFPAADTVGIATNGVARYIFGPTGNATFTNNSNINQFVLSGTNAATSGTVSQLIFSQGSDSIASINAINAGSLDSGILTFATQSAGSINTERARITSGGFFGIGNSNPTVLLDVKTANTTANEVVAQFGNNNIVGGLQIRTTDGNLVWDLNALNSRNLTFSTNQTERARITSAGTLLVNATSDPTGLSAKHYVNGLIGAINIQSGYTGYTNYNSLSVVRSDQSAVGQTDKAIIDVVTSTGSARFLHLNVDASTTSAEYRIGRLGHHSWHTGNSATELMRLTNAGSLRINDTSGDLGKVLFSLSDTTAFSATALTTTNMNSDALVVKNTNASDTGFVGIVLKNKATSLGAARIAVTGGSTTSALSFQVRPSSGADATTEAMRLTSTGALLVGTPTDPGYTAKLHVAGGISLDNVANSNARVLDWYEEGTFTATATGMTTSPTGTVKYTRIGNSVTLEIPTISGTSNATTFTLTGVPSHLRPSASKYVAIRIQNNTGVRVWGVMVVDGIGNLQLYATPNGDAFTASGIKEVSQGSVTYTLQ